MATRFARHPPLDSQVFFIILRCSRMDLSAMETQLELSHKDQEAQQAQKRLELYDVTFQAEMEDYRRRRETEVSSLYQGNRAREREEDQKGGKVAHFRCSSHLKVNPTISGSRPSMSTTLENLHLDDNHTTKDLDTFLSDEEDEQQQDTSAMRRRAKKPARASAADDDDDDDEDGPVVEILADEDYASE